MKKNILGKRISKIDSAPKATGAAQYTADLKMTGMLYGKILRSTLAHARIVSIDVSKAKALPGVRGVITADDVPLNRFSFGQFKPDKHMLCKNKVRYVGDEVAAVAAVDLDTAEEALELIKVQYEELPAVFDAEAAMQPDAPLLHAGDSNVCFSIERNYGNVEKAFEECDFVVEGRYRTNPVAHCCLEVQNCIAKWDASGRLTVWTNTQAPHTQRQELARILGIPLKDVRVISSHMGGGFGSKLVMDMKEPIAAVLSKTTGRFVKIENTRDEEFATAKTRYGYTMYVRTGAKKDGRLWAREAKMVADNGAYNDKGLATINFASMMFATLYNIPNIRFEAKLVYTNKQMGTAFRGFGNPQLTFACEVQLDELAEKMGIDPFGLRMKNANYSGQVLQCGAVVPATELKKCMLSASKSIEGEKRADGQGLRLRGVGMANMVHSGHGGRFYNYNATDSYIKLADDGTLSIVTPALDMGQGLHTVVAMIVAEELGVELNAVRVISNDTDLTPYDLGSWGSRGTFILGNAALAAARNIKRKILEVAADMTDVSPEYVTLQDNRVRAAGPGVPEKTFTLAELADYAIKKIKAPLSAEGQYADKIPPDWDVKMEFVNNVKHFSFATQAVEVEVNRQTGEVKVLRAAAAHETGTTINADMAEGQIEGAVVQGIGFALMESFVFDKGRVVNDGFLDYKLPTFVEQPEIVVHLIESAEPEGPFGAKGIGECGIVPTAAAIANAVYHACGVRCRELPITRTHILNELAKMKGSVTDS